MANTENRLSTLPKDTESLELNSLKDANNTTLNEILDTINGVLSSRPNLTEIQTAEAYLANLKILSERYQSGIKDSMQSDNLDEEFNLYVGTKKRLQLLKNEMRQSMRNDSSMYDPSSDTDPNIRRPLKNRKPGGTPLDDMMKGDNGQEITSGTIGQQSAFYDNARGYGSIEGKFSDSTGFSAEGILSHMIGENTAIAVDVEAGSKQSRFLSTLGYKITENQRIKLTYEHFRRLTDFMFSSGEVSETMAQNSLGATYRLKLDRETLKYLELNGYMSKTSSKELEDKTFYIDTPTLYELYNNKRRIAGGKKQGGSVSLGLEPWKGGELRLTANYESTKVDTRYENGRDVSRFGGKASLTQKLNDKTSLEVGVGTSSTESLLTEAKLRYSLPENVSLYISGQNIRRRSDIGGSDANENIVAVGVDGNIPSWVPLLGDDTEKIEESKRIFEQSKANRKPRPYMPALDMDRNPDALPPLTKNQSKQYNEFLVWVATQPAVKSYTVIALRDQRNDRIVVIDKTILPAAAHPDLMTGDLIVDIALATGIAGVTMNGAPYANNNNFVLNSSKNQLIINTATLAVPPVGVTQTYVVTINEVGGGQTLVTLDVQHGSVRISRVDVQRVAPAAPDTTPNAFTFVDQNNVALSTLIQSAPITVAGIDSASAITIAGAGGQYRINGGAWTAAAGTVNNGDVVEVRHTSSGANSTAVNTTLTIGGVSDIFTTTTEAFVPPANNPPVPTYTTFTMNEDTVKNGTLTATDADGNPLTYAKVADPSHGAVTVNADGTFTYTPVANYFGADAFTYSVTDGTATVNQVVSITVNDVVEPNAPPEAINSTYLTDIGNASKTFDWKVLLTATDVNGDTLTATVQVQGTKGVFAIVGDNITYTPNAGQTGSDICTIRISDGQGNTIDRTITVNNIDTLAPTTPTLSLAAGAAYTKNLNIAASVTDDVGATGWYISESSSTPALGDFVAEPNTFNLSGGDGLKTVYVWTRDAAGNISNAGSDTITLDTIAPTLTNLPNFGAGVASGSTTAKTIDMNDNNNVFTDASAISISADNGASITGFDNSSYGTKSFNFVAPVNPGPGPLTVTITYTITDAAGNVTTTTQTVDVDAAVNTLPVANDVTRDAAGAPGITYDLAPDISDVETADAGLTIVVESGPLHVGAGGSFVWDTNTQFTLTANPGYIGNDSFTYHIVDGNGGISPTKTVTINDLAG